ncbi:MAG: bifunctional oligoribonuclease/PAP phosphatase NrnA [Mariprofundaceae bacterium]
MSFILFDTNWQPIKQAIENANGIILITHRNPDADGIGSQLALFQALTSMGKHVCMHNRDVIPRICRYLPSSEQIGNGDFPETTEFDTIISLDCGALSRLAMPDVFFAGKTLINIDHHASNNGFGDVNLVAAHYCATGAMVFDLIKAMRCSLSENMAIPLYAALLTDTCSFRATNVNPDVHRLAAELIEAGANPAESASAIYEQNTLAQIQLKQRCLSTLEIYDDQCSAWLHITQDMLQETGASIEDSEGFTDLARAIANVKVAVFIRPDSENGWKASFRGKGVDVSILAASLNGGGHKHAAGCSLAGSFEQVKDQLRQAVTLALS